MQATAGSHRCGSALQCQGATKTVQHIQQSDWTCARSDVGVPCHHQLACLRHRTASRNHIQVAGDGGSPQRHGASVAIDGQILRHTQGALRDHRASHIQRHRTTALCGAKGQCRVARDGNSSPRPAVGLVERQGTRKSIVGLSQRRHLGGASVGGEGAGATDAQRSSCLLRHTTRSTLTMRDAHKMAAQAHISQHDLVGL